LVKISSFFLGLAQHYQAGVVNTKLFKRWLG